MQGRSFIYNVKDLKLSGEQIAKVIGYTAADTPQIVSELIEITLHDSLSLDSVKAEYRIFDDLNMDMQTASVSFASTVFNTRKIILSQLRGSTMAALFLATAGPEIGEKSREQMAAGDLLEGYITDVVGSEIVEAAIDRMQSELAESARESGLNITNRFSPGYCGWDVAEQHKLFSLMPDNYCGICLTESALMNPIKSVSGMIGIGKEARYQPYTCNRCESTNCIYRDKRHKSR
ncbi:MAG: vitamin B12 dependent-methionine synthase activation domain-containing protein [Bacteroidales bacterium]|nr:vitamin B12 dependent-methionine synthase activation domain-containing protein [Bacteroidales bacterium]